MTSATLLLRQVHPSFVQAGRVTSQVFRPTPKDALLLSVYDGDLIDPEDAWKHFMSSTDCLSVGVLAVSVAECESISLTARPDPEPFLEHGVIDFSNFSQSQVEKASKKLKAFAEARGWQFRPQLG